MKSRLMDRRTFLARGAAAAGLAAAGCATERDARADAPAAYDLVVRGGTLIDGTGAAGVVADVAVRGDRVVAVGVVDAARAARVLDASGLVVAPGFVDIHTHSDAAVFEWPSADSRIRQGCTTEITGNCGGSAAPRDPARSVEDDVGPRATWTDVRSYFAAWAAERPAVNHALLVGHGTLRRAALGDEDRPATTAELAAMTRALEAALEQGAIGLSTGLEYVPGMFAPPEEVAALARVVARRGGLYATHMRNEEEGLHGAVIEALDVARATGVRLQISHLKAAGKPNWRLQENALKLIERARASGLDVMADAYPYAAYSTTLTILLEPWSREGGSEAVMKRLQDAELRARMKREVGPHVARDPGDFASVVISSVGAPALQAAVGRSVAQLAEDWSVEPAEAFLRLLEGSGADVGYVGHAMSEENVERVLAHPLVMIGSDGRCMAPTGRALKTKPHPRSYGTFARVLGLYARERALFDLPTAVRKMTALPAERAGLKDRGVLKVGAFADLVAFDPARVADGATFDAPQTYAAGVPYVVVNGAPVVVDGVPTAERPGRVLAAG
jgi:N-acyl-D-amino-acid deacylase